MKLDVRTEPRITFSAFAEFLGEVSFTRRFEILHDQKYPPTGPIKSYKAALKQIRANAISNVAFAPSSPELRSHEREIISLLVANGWKCPAAAAAFPSAQQKPLVLAKVEISVYPDLLLVDTVNGKRATGALKMFFPKSRVLSPDAARCMAALLYFYKSEVQGDVLASPELCVVHDCRRGKTYHASGNYKKLLKNAENACRMIEMTWDRL